MPKGLTWHVTGLWHPSHTVLADLPYYGMIADPIDGEVEIPLNDSRLASVTVSEWNPIIEALRDPTTKRGLTYARCLKVYYRDLLVFWGPIKLIEYGLEVMDTGTVKISAAGPSVRLVHHYLRRGDTALDGPHGDTGNVTIDYAGLRLLRDAGLNTAAQTARDVPDLGIIDGTHSGDLAPGSRIGVQRGDEVFGSMTQLSQNAGAPDFEEEPVENTVGAYAKLNIYDRQGSDVSAEVAFHYGTGKQNVERIAFTDGSQYVTHAHVLSSDRKRRVTVANLAASAETGPYVVWEVTEFDVTDMTTAEADRVLRAHGRDILSAYSRPLLTCQLTLPPENDSDENGYVYGTDYIAGDTVGIAARSGLIDLEDAPYRITAVRLRQADSDNNVRPEIEVVPDRVGSEVTGGVHLEDADFTDTDDGVTRVPIDGGFDWAWGSSGVKRNWFATTNGVLVAQDGGGSPDAFLYDLAITDFAEPGNLYGVALIAGDMALASAAGYSYPGYSGISYTTVGTAPNRVFVVTFDLPFLSGTEVGGEHITAQAQMHEDGTIEIHYATFDLNPADALTNLTIGIWWRDSTSTDRTLLGSIAGSTYNDQWPAGAIPPGQAVRFTPAGDLWSQAACTFNWIDTSTEDA